jgi:hypothetical protein
MLSMEVQKKRVLYVSGSIGLGHVYSQTTPEILAEKVIANLDKNVDYPPIPVQGDQKAARLIGELL